VATAMVLYEVARRGWMKQISGAAPAPRIVRPQLPAPALKAPEPENLAAVAADLVPTHDADEQAFAAVDPARDAVDPTGDAVEPAPDASVGHEATAVEPATVASEPPAELTLGLEPEPLAGFQGDIQL